MSHLTDGQQSELTRGIARKRAQDTSEVNRECGSHREGWPRRERGDRLETTGRPAGSRSPRTEEYGFPCPLWGTACCYCGERSEVSPGAVPYFLSTPVSPVSPFLAEPNTDEARFVSPVWFHSHTTPAKASALARPHYRSREESRLVAALKRGGAAHVY